MTEPIVRFERIDKSYDGETLVVKDLNLDVALVHQIAGVVDPALKQRQPIHA